MHVGITSGPLFSFLLGVLIGVFIRYPLKPAAAGRRVTAVLWLVFTAGGWLLYAGLLAYWHLSVEPRLDGSEGSGVGFGYVFIYIGGMMPAMFCTGGLVARLVINARSSSSEGT